MPRKKQDLNLISHEVDKKLAVCMARALEAVHQQLIIERNSSLGLWTTSRLNDAVIRARGAGLLDFEFLKGDTNAAHD